MLEEIPKMTYKSNCVINMIEFRLSRLDREEYVIVGCKAV
jgi:hypothetical protein